MRMANINAGEENGRHVGQFFAEHCVELHDYFLPQLGNASEAEACVEKTMNLLFFFMEDRCWEEDRENIPVYLKRIAGGVCTEKLSEKMARHESSLLNRVGNELAQTFKAQKDLARRLLRGEDGGGQPGGQRIPSLQHPTTASV